MEVQWRNRPFYKSNQCKIPRKEDQRILQGKSLAGGKGLKQHLLKFFSSYLFWGFSAVGSPDPLSKHSNKASLPERNTKLRGKKQNAPGVLGRGPGRAGWQLRGENHSKGGSGVQTLPPHLASALTLQALLRPSGDTVLCNCTCGSYSHEWTGGNGSEKDGWEIISQGQINRIWNLTWLDF